MGIQDCALYLASSDVEDDTGSAVMSFVSVFTYNNVLMPYLIDAESVTTTRTDSDEWNAALDVGSCTVNMSGSDKMTVSGSFRNGDFATVAINATFKKVTQSQYTQINDIDSVLNGTWRTSTEPNAQTGGGFLVRPGAFAAGSGAFANVVFSDTNIADKTTKIKATGFFRTAEGILAPVNVYNLSTSISRMFGNYYRLRISYRYGGVLTGLFALTDTDKAQLILQDGMNDAVIHAVFLLEKMPANDSLNTADLVPSSWSLTGGGTAVYNSMIIPVAASDDFTVSIDSREGNSASLTISGKLVSTADSQTVREYDNETRPVSFEHIGYNTFYGEHKGDGVSLVGEAIKR